MSNKDINKQDSSKNNTEEDTFIKDNLHLFSFSLLKSKSKFTLSEHFNSLNVDFSKDSYEPKNSKNKENSDIINNRKIILIDGDNNSSLKTLNIEVPSSEKLSNEKFKNDFMNEYENSFANYSGINKSQFSDIYINNLYKPILDEFGDINISIKYIVDLIKTYSKNIKAGKKVLKRNRIKKIFKTLKKKYEKYKKNRLFFEVKKIEGNKEINEIEPIKNINDIKKPEIKIIQQLENSKVYNENYTNKEKYYTNNNIRNTVVHDLKDIQKKLLSRRGNISIPKPNNQYNEQKKLSIGLNNSSLGLNNNNGKKSNFNIGNNFFNYNIVNNDISKQNNINNNVPLQSFEFFPGGFPFSDCKKNTPTKYNVNAFNFHPAFIQNLNNGNPTQPNISNILSNNNNTFNGFNFNLKNQLQSPMLNLFSPYFPNSNISTPISPYISEYIYQDKTPFNNLYQNSFFFPNNNATPINNSNINLNNNIMNNNINNKKLNDNNKIINNNMNNSNFANK